VDASIIFKIRSAKAILIASNLTVQMLRKASRNFMAYVSMTNAYAAVETLRMGYIASRLWLFLYLVRNLLIQIINKEVKDCCKTNPHYIRDKQIRSCF
jgi:hypothetical protein